MAPTSDTSTQEAPAETEVNGDELFVQWGLVDFRFCDRRCNGFMSGNHKGTFKFIVAPKGTKIKDLPREFRSHPYRPSTLMRKGFAINEGEIRTGVVALNQAAIELARGQKINITYEGPHTVTDVRTDQDLTFHVFVIELSP